MKKKYLIGILLSILFLYLAFRGVNFGEFIDVFKEIKYVYAIPVVLFNLIGFVFRAYRWQYFLKPIKSIRFMNVFSSVMISFMANNVLPARLGEFVRAYTIGKMEKISKSTAFATVVVERILDILFVLFLFFLLLSLFPFAAFIPENLKRNTYQFLIFFFVGFFILIFMVWKKEFVLSIVEKMVRRFPETMAARIHRITDSFIKGLAFFRNTHDFFPIMLITIIMWGFYIGSYYFAFSAFGFFENDLSAYFLAGVIILVVGSVGVMIPSAPGAIGTFHYFCSLGLLFLGIMDENQRMAYATFVHTVNYIGVTAVGFLFLIKERLHFSEMKLEDEDK